VQVGTAQKDARSITANELPNSSDHIFVRVCPIPKPLAGVGSLSNTDSNGCRGSPFYITTQCATHTNTQRIYCAYIYAHRAKRVN